MLWVMICKVDKFSFFVICFRYCLRFFVDYFIVVLFVGYVLGVLSDV